MKAPAKAAGGKRIAEKPRGKGKGTGINAKVEKESVPQRVARTTYGQPTPRQKL